MQTRYRLAVSIVALALSGCVHPNPAPPASKATAPALSGDLAHPGTTQGWAEAKLYFGLGSADHPEQGVSEDQWRSFLDKEVTPRFPSGLSVLDVYGQWQGKQESAPERLHSKMLLIYLPDNAENRAKIDAIRTAWKQKTGDQSVLLAIEPAEVSF